MLNFLSFDTFITKYILIGCYYCGAVLMPIFLWISRDKICSKFQVCINFQNRVLAEFKELPLKDRLILIIFFISIFLMMELAWRMMFETMIAYFQMRDYLYMISHQV